MTRLLNEGAEMQDVLFWSGGSLAFVTASNTSPTPYASLYYYKLTGNGYNLYKNIPALTEGYVRYRFNSSSLPTDGRIITFRSGTNIICYLALDTLGHWSTYRAGTLLEDSNVTFTFNRWYLIEVYFKLHDTSGRFVVYVDGTKILDYTGDTNPSTYPSFDNLYFACGAGASSNICIDDLALNDTNGNTDNGWCGDGILIRLSPKGNGVFSEWTGSDGDKLNNYLLVDEYPKDDDTTYVVTSGVLSGAIKDSYTISGYSWQDRSILRIYTEARARKTVASGFWLKLGLIPSGGSVVTSSNLDLSTTYDIVTGSGFTINPYTSQPWTGTDVTDLQLVIESSS